MRKYTIENLATALKNPSSLLGEIRALGLKINRWYHNNYINNDGEYVLDKDWDNLIILDACRYDLFKEVNDIQGELSSMKSRGSTSLEYLNENFKGQQLHDTVYISANPYTYDLEIGTFYEIYDLLKTDWDGDKETVLPGRVVERAIEAHNEHQNKRLIIHFMQPHYPFIGELGNDISHRGYDNKHDAGANTNREYTVWGKLQYNLDGLTEDMAWEAYRENLEIVLNHVKRLLGHLEGKTVITSDHGNLVGERLSPVPVKGYAHPGYLRMDELTTVPWFEIDYSERREIVSEQPTSIDNDIEVNEEKLEALGYLS